MSALQGSGRQAPRRHFPGLIEECAHIENRLVGGITDQCSPYVQRPAGARHDPEPGSDLGGLTCLLLFALSLMLVDGLAELIGLLFQDRGLLLVAVALVFALAGMGAICAYHVHCGEDGQHAENDGSYHRVESRAKERHERTVRVTAVSQPPYGLSCAGPVADLMQDEPAAGNAVVMAMAGKTYIVEDADENAKSKIPPGLFPGPSRA